MVIKDIDLEIGSAKPAVHRIIEPDEWTGSVIVQGNTATDLAGASATEPVLASGEYPVQICGDFGLLAELCLAPAYSAFAVGDKQRGCVKIWEAAKFALSVVGESRGRPCQTEDDHFDLLEGLQAETGIYEDPDILAGYHVVCHYRDNAEYGFLEDYAIKGGLPEVRRFITGLLSLAGAAV